VTIFKFGGTGYMERFHWSGNFFSFYSTGHNCVWIQKVWCSADHTVHSHVSSHNVLYDP